MARVRKRPLRALAFDLHSLEVNENIGEWDLARDSQADSLSRSQRPAWERNCPRGGYWSWNMRAMDSDIAFGFRHGCPALLEQDASSTLSNELGAQRAIRWLSSTNTAKHSLRHNSSCIDLDYIANYNSNHQCENFSECVFRKLGSGGYLRFRCNSNTLKCFETNHFRTRVLHRISGSRSRRPIDRVTR